MSRVKLPGGRWSDDDTAVVVYPESRITSRRSGHNGGSAACTWPGCKHRRSPRLPYCKQHMAPETAFPPRLDESLRRHLQSRTCPKCRSSVSREALVNLAYVFTACDCGDPEYPHLYEQLWHIACFRPPVEEAP